MPLLLHLWSTGLHQVRQCLFAARACNGENSGAVRPLQNLPTERNSSGQRMPCRLSTCYEGLQVYRMRQESSTGCACHSALVYVAKSIDSAIREALRAARSAKYGKEAPSCPHLRRVLGDVAVAPRARGGGHGIQRSARLRAEAVHRRAVAVQAQRGLVGLEPRARARAACRAPARCARALRRACAGEEVDRETACRQFSTALLAPVLRCLGRLAAGVCACAATLGSAGAMPSAPVHSAAPATVDRQASKNSHKLIEPLKCRRSIGTVRAPYAAPALRASDQLVRLTPLAPSRELSQRSRVRASGAQLCCPTQHSLDDWSAPQNWLLHVHCVLVAPQESTEHASYNTRFTDAEGAI